MTTYIPKGDDLARKWFVVDAKDQVLGKLATTAADINEPPDELSRGGSV